MYHNRSNPSSHIDRYSSGPRRDNRDSRDYDSRDRRDSDYSSRGSYRSRDDAKSAPSEYAGSSSTSSGKYQDPYKLTFQVPFTQFCEWVKQNLPVEDNLPTTDELYSKYDKYKLDLYARIARGFVVQHINDVWFKERYVPEIADPIKGSLVDYRKKLYDDFFEDLESGKYDQFSLDGSRPGIPTTSSNGKDEIKPSDSAAKPEATDAATMDVDTAASENADSDRKKEDEEGEEAVPEDGEEATATDHSTASHDQKVLIIKSIAPNISRAQLMDLVKTVPGFQFLSLSDPNPTKRYYRIGWVMLSDDSDPKVAMEMLEGKSISTADETGSSEFSEFVVHVGIHSMSRPMKRKYLFPYLSSSAQIRKDCTTAKSVAEKFEKEFNDPNYLGGIDKIYSHAEKLATESFRAASLAKKEDIDDQDEEGMVVEEDDDSRLQDEISKKQFDLTYLYLRLVYAFCFYCISGCDSICDLNKKCPAGHLRRTAPGPDADEETKKSFEVPDARVEQWLRSWEEKLSLFITPGSANVTKYGGLPIDELVEKEISSHVRNEDEAKSRCKVGTCTKLFKAEEFVKKHIAKKHPDFIAAVEQEGALLNAYVLDACRILPARSEGPLPLAPVDSTPAEPDYQSIFTSSNMVSIFGGLPIVIPPTLQNNGRAASGNGLNGLHHADPFEASLMSSSPPSSKNKRSSLPFNSNTPVNRGRDQEWRPSDRNRGPHRSRSPQPRDRGDYRDRREYRDRSDYRDDRRDRDYRRDYPPIDRYRGRGERSRDRDYRDRPPARDDPRAGKVGDPRGRSLRSYEDIAPEKIELEY
ncbi:hypothetical protein BZA70DRAFT_288316 [Myxozyma melibiosi]|uniref:C2H2-type domain-containing protein n=1 Tax=Myxozyma melibiosi TaxID=54550 RepID=A0ABR1FAJ6_9ASCO